MSVIYQLLLTQLSSWHLSRQHLSWRYLSISPISHLLMARFWPNFKGRFLEPFWTYFNCNGDIFLGKICPSDVCPYQQYISWYWPDFDQILKVGSCDLFGHIPTVTVTFVKKICPPPQKKIGQGFCSQKIC